MGRTHSSSVDEHKSPKSLGQSLVEQFSQILTHEGAFRHRVPAGFSPATQTYISQDVDMK